MFATGLIRTSPCGYSVKFFLADLKRSFLDVVYDVAYLWLAERFANYSPG